MYDIANSLQIPQVFTMITHPKPYNIKPTSIKMRQTHIFPQILANTPTIPPITLKNGYLPPKYP